MKNSLKRILFLALSLLLASVFSVSAFAEVPYESYTYWTDVGEESKAVYNRPMYTPEDSIDAQSLGIAPFTQITDITTTAAIIAGTFSRPKPLSRSC